MRPPEVLGYLNCLVSPAGLLVLQLGYVSLVGSIASGDVSVEVFSGCFIHDQWLEVGNQRLVRSHDLKVLLNQPLEFVDRLGFFEVTCNPFRVNDW